jgi:putative tryptophan/tyrosine transport system substrate-binding protein
MSVAMSAFRRLTRQSGPTIHVSSWHSRAHASVDHVESGLVPRLSGSGDNVTGVTFFSNDLAPKRLEVMSEMLPSARVFAILMNSRNPGIDRDIKQVQAAAAARGVTMSIVYAAGEGTPETAFAELAERQVHGILVLNDSVLYSRIRTIIALADA